MTSGIVPVGKVVYVCDDVLEDPANGKLHLLGVCDAIRPPGGAGAYPYQLRQLCVFAQLVGGHGQVSAHVEVVHRATLTSIFRSAPAMLQFPSRQTTVNALFRILNCRFPAPDDYLVELYCQDMFVDDRPLHLLT